MFAKIKRFLNRSRPARADINRLKALRNKFQGRRIFVIGNGPSLKYVDFSLLKKELTIASNGIFLLFDKFDFMPAFYTVEDTLVAEDRAEAINKIRGCTKIFPADLDYCICRDEETIFINFIRNYYRGFPKFTNDFVKRVYWGGTVSFLNLQLAYFLGCGPIYMIGMDHNYLPPTGKDEQSGTVITARTDDRNHFHPDYFGPGYRYHDPMVSRMETGYKVARQFVESNNNSIINATHGGKLEVFKRVNFEDLF